MFMNGGELVKSSYEPVVLVTYEAEGTVPAGVTYHLVRTASGQEGLFEQGADGSGTVFTNQWRDGGEDHFFGWVGSSHGYEFVIPVDRSKPGRKYVYPAGYFSVNDSDGIQRPECPVELDPVATLTPGGQ
jgi:hypothetical protein